MIGRRRSKIASTALAMVARSTRSCQSVHQHRDGSSDADGVGDLDLAAFSGAEATTCFATQRAAYAAERSTWKGPYPRTPHHRGEPCTVGIDDDLSASQSRVGVGTAKYEIARGIHEDPHRALSRSRAAWPDHVLEHVVLDRGLRVVAVLVLGRDEHRVHATGRSPS